MSTRTARCETSSIVKTSRSQSHEAPSRMCWCEMTLRYFRTQAQTRSTNCSRPRSWRVSPSFASSFSTTFWVAIPAWSTPGSHSVASPSMRRQRTKQSGDRVLEGVPEVQLAGHVRRRHDDAERISSGLDARPKVAAVQPHLVQRLLDLRRVVGLGHVLILCLLSHIYEYTP